MKGPLAASLSLALAAVAPAQDEKKPFDPYGPPPGARKVHDKVEFRIDAAGQITIFPSPSHGYRTMPGDPVIPTIDRGLQNAGLFGLLTLLAPGDTDLASSTGASRFFDRLKMSGDERIVSVLEAPLPADAAHAARLRQLLAVRVAGERDLQETKPLLESIRAAEKERGEDADGLFLEAIENTLRRFERKPTQTRQVPDIDFENALQSAPAKTCAVLRIDNFRLPPTGFGPISEKTGLEVTRRMINEAGGTMTEAAWAGAQSLAAAGSLMPYELARLVGNLRIDRCLVAMAMHSSGRRPGDVMVRLDGTYDHNLVRSLLLQEGFAADPNDPEVLSKGPDGYYTLRLSERFMELRYWDGESGGYKAIGDSQRKKQLAFLTAIQDEAPVSWIIRPPRGAEQSLLAGLPAWSTIDVDRNNSRFVRVELGFRDGEESRRFARTAESFRDGLSTNYGVELPGLRIRTDDEEATVLIEGDIQSAWSDELVRVLADLF